MSDLVVDSSIVFKWFVAEDDSDIAHSVLDAWKMQKLKCHAPDWMLAEVGNILWKRQRRTEITTDFASDCLKDVNALPLEWADARSLLPAAMTLAMTHGRTVYDSIYLALALRLNCPFVTADDRLANAVAPHVPNVVKLSDWKPSPPTTPPSATTPSE
jgi:predicted nucleic acid-binding protein